MVNRKLCWLTFVCILLGFILFQGQNAEAAPEIPAAINSKEAANWTQFKQLLSDSTVDEIKITGNFSANNNITTNVFPARNLTIDGQGKYTIDMNVFWMNMASSSSGPKLFTVKNLKLTGLVTCTYPVFYTAGNTLHLNNVTISQRGAVIAKEATVYASGKTSFELGPDVKYLKTVFDCKSLIIEDECTFINERSAASPDENAVFFNSSADNPSINIQNSNFSITSNVDIFYLGKPTKLNISNNATIHIKKANNFIKATQTLDLEMNNATLDLANANNFIISDSAINAKFQNKVDVIRDGQKSTGLLTTINTSPIFTAPISVEMNNATFTGTQDIVYLAKTEGDNSPLKVDVKNSKIELEKGGFFQSTKSKMTLTSDNSQYLAKQLTGNFIYGKTVDSSLKKSSIRIESAESNVFQSNTGTGGGQMDFVDSTIYLRQNDTINTVGFLISDPKTILSFDNSNIDAKMTNRLFSIYSAAEDSTLSIKNGSKWDAYSKVSNVIRTGSDVTSEKENGLSNASRAKMGSKNFNLIIDGHTTDVNLSGDSKGEEINGGILSIIGPNSKLTMNNGAKLAVKSLNDSNIGVATPAILLQTLNGGFYLDNQSKLAIENHSKNPPTVNYNQEAAIRFRVAGSMTFQIDHDSSINVYKTGVSAGVRMYGGNNKVSVNNGSDFTVHNKGDGKVSDGGAAGNMAVQFVPDNSITTNLKSQFLISGKDSNINLVADYGLAIDGGDDQLEITASKDSYFIARGQSATAETGIFNAKGMNINFDTMNFSDFANTRPNGGTLFSAKNNDSSLVAARTNLSLWLAEKGQQVMEKDPSKSFYGQTFNLTGTNLNTFTSGSNEIKNYLATIGGTSKISRMTGNNQGAIIETIRTPTNADKTIWAHASVNEEKGSSPRPAYENEVHVKVEVRNPDHSIAYTTEGVSIGNGPDGKGVSIYGEEKKTGLVKIPVPNNEFIKTGQTVHLVEAWIDLGEGAKLPSKPSDLKAEPVTVLDVTPPKKSIVEKVTNATKQLTGTSNENGAKVFIKANNEWLKDNEGNLISTVVAENKWLINLPYYVTKETKVDVYLKDETVLPLIPNYALPKTYTLEPDGVAGNINFPVDDDASYLGYHDAIKSDDSDLRFDSATRLIVEDVLPVPQLEQLVASSGGETTSYGDTLIYTFRATNTSKTAEPWKNVILTDELATEIDFDPMDHEITIDGEQAEPNQFDYDKDTRQLTIKLGDIKGQQTVVSTLKVTVSRNALLGKNIFNLGMVTGDSPQEDPFVVGAINPENEHKILSATSNKLGVPGNSVYGDLSFVSAPESLNFGELRYSATTKRVEAAKFTEKLTVNDIRENVKTGWYVTATLSQGMRNEKQEELRNALRYVYKGKESILNDNAQIVYTNLDIKRGEHVISDSWGNTKGADGVKLQLDGTEDVGTGVYNGVITWKLMAGQP